MADRNSLIKFGPEWLRNLSREGSATHSTASGSTPPNTAPGNVAGAAANTPPKVHLAKLRYGREELLALYDREVEPPAELKHFEALYNPRGKAPLALQNTFEEEMRDSMRSGGSSMGGMGSGERMSRGSAHQSDGRGRGRSSFSRLNSGGRGYKSGMAGQLGYPDRGGDEPFEVPANSNRVWGSSNGGNSTQRNGADPNVEWLQTNKTYRGGGHRWQANTNWRRQVGREEGEEWRSQQDPNKPRPNPQEKWERDWNERGDRGHSSRDKNQSWNTNRRTWGHNDDSLPEWAVENAEACGGTFDSSGAFHGYSNDDTNLPKPPVPDPVYPLTRSHTQGSLTRAKVDEEGSDEWWASEKAKKLSPKRFDASEIKFKKQSSAPEGSHASGSNDETQSKFPDNPESELNDSKLDDKHGKKVQFKRSLVESKTFDGANRSDVNLDDANDERGNFKSVIIAPNNMLRQRHQNIVSSSNEGTRPAAPNVKYTQSGKNVTTTASSAGAAASAKESNNSKQKGSQEEKLVNNMQKFSLRDRESAPLKPQDNSLGNDKMGYPFGEQDLADIPLPPAPKPAKPGLNVSLTATSCSMATMKSPGLHQPNMSTAVASGMSTSPYQSTASYQSTGKQAGSMASTLFGNVGFGKSGLGPGMGHVGNTGLGNSAHSGLNNQMHSALNNPVHSGLANSQHTNLGSSGHSGLGNVGLGNPGHPGLGNAGLGNSSHAGLRNSPHAGLGSSQHAGLGSSPHASLGSSPHAGLGSSQHAGLGSSPHAGLGNSQHAGLVGSPHASLGSSQHAGLGSSPHAGLGSSQHAGLGSSPHAGLGSSQHAGLGSSPHAGLGSSQHTGLGSSPHVSLGSSQHASLGNSQHAGLGSSPHAGLGHSQHSGLGNSGLGLQFGSASSSLGMVSPGLSGPTAAPGASLSFSNSASNNTGKNSLFISQNNTNIGVSQTNEMNSPQPKSAAASMFQLHDMPQQAPGGFGSSMYGSVLPPPSQQPSAQTDMWYYEDPTKNIQGPFSSKEMYHWYRAGFFTSSLMVRRACDSQMQPLGSLGPVAPFAMVMNPMNLNEPALDNMQFGNVGNNFIRSTSFSQQPMDNLWSQSASSTSDLWMQPPQAQRHSDSRATNLNMFFWEQQPSVISSNSLLPEEIAKEMKTEDQILAQIRSSQNMANNPTVPFLKQETQGVSVTSVLPTPEEAKLGATPDLGELEKLIQKETLTAITPRSDASSDKVSNFMSTHDKKSLNEESNLVSLQNKTVVQQQQKNKSDGEKAVVKKDTTSTKKKKTKDDKKDESTDLKKEEDCFKNEKVHQNAIFNLKKDDKASKKDMEKEKKEWLKDGFTLVKGPEKNAYKDKKKIDENKALEEADKKRKEEEKLAAEKDKKKVEILKRPGAVGSIGAPGQGRLPMSEGSGAIRKAPWSAVSAQNPQAPSKDGITLAEIQRLEREKKLEQMKEQQQQMMIMLAQQHHAELAREQELAQNVIGWAKKKGTGAASPTSLSLAEIQAETRKQSAAAAAAAAAVAAELAVHQALDQGMQPPSSLPPWKATPNVSGFWETERAKKKQQSAVTEKPQEYKQAEPKIKKKPATQGSAATSGNASAGAGTSSSAGAYANANASASSSAATSAAAYKPPKKEVTPWLEFETWCNHSLNAWTAKIDVPTFVGFLKDIESPYEVKDYVKCYLGETKDSNDFARQFLERRSKLLRASTETPVDDLCSPAAAINPRGGLDFSEGKGKKPKKNKMLKIDARILGFSVTAAEDRINVGDIDTA